MVDCSACGVKGGVRHSPGCPRKRKAPRKAKPPAPPQPSASAPPTVEQKVPEEVVKASFPSPDDFGKVLESDAPKEDPATAVKGKKAPTTATFPIAMIIMGCNAFFPEKYKALQFTLEEAKQLEDAVNSIGFEIEARPGEAVKIPWWAGIAVVLAGILLPRIPAIIAMIKDAMADMRAKKEKPKEEPKA